MSVKKAKREFAAFVESLCPDCEVEQTAKGHLVATFVGPNGTEVVVQSGTPSDGRSLRNAKAQCRRAAAKVGLAPA